MVPGPPPQEQSEDGSQVDAEKFPEEEASEETKVVPSDRVSDILPDAVKLLSSAQLTFNNFLSGRGNSEWVRDKQPQCCPRVPQHSEEPQEGSSASD